MTGSEAFHTSFEFGSLILVMDNYLKFIASSWLDVVSSVLYLHELEGQKSGRRVLGRAPDE